jgi:hypothetical protein
MGAINVSVDAIPQRIRDRTKYFQQEIPINVNDYINNLTDRNFLSTLKGGITRVSATLGRGSIAGDTEIQFAGVDKNSFPEWIDESQIVVYVSDSTIDKYQNMINMYQVESIEPIRQTGGYEWRIRGRDITNILMNTRITENYDEGLEYTVGESTGYPTASLIIRHILRSYFTADTEAATEIDGSGVSTLKQDRDTSFPVISYSCSNKAMSDVLDELSSDTYTQDGSYDWKLSVDNQNRQITLVWGPSKKDKLAYHNRSDENKVYTCERIAQRIEFRSNNKFESTACSLTSFGTDLTGYISLNADAGTEPGDELIRTASQDIHSGDLELYFTSTHQIDPDTTYWLVLHVESGSATVQGSVTGTSNVMYYDGSWNDESEIYNMSYNLYGNLVETHLDTNSRDDIISVKPEKSYYDIPNLITLDCGKDPSGVPIIIDVLSESTAYTYGIKTVVKSRPELAEEWISENPEPEDYPEDVDGTAVSNYSGYVELCRDRVEEKGRRTGKKILNSIGENNVPKWRMDVTMIGNHDYRIGQNIRFESDKLGVHYRRDGSGGANRLGLGDFRVEGITHEIDPSGWYTTLNLLER